ncbi:porin [Burkholderia sp. WSM2232]|uniref:porin n=1 Tax=Burkholderia sp. WSM2232 TaxID=944436 RepID=UPI00042914EB|nr:porin [Burkholderia sp. WSM2232]
MKKTLLAATAVVSLSALQGAWAQSSVTLYGVVDNGIEYQDGGENKVVRASSGGLFATVYGMIGHEDIGGGVHVNFQLEQGFSSFTGVAQVAGDAFNRLAWVGMSGGFGEFRVGRQKKPQYLFLDGELDPIAGKSIASSFSDLATVSVRASNALTYFAPRYRGLEAQFMVALRDSTTKPSNGIQLYNAVARYINGPFHLAVGYEQQANAAGTSIQRNLTLASSLRFDATRFHLVYTTERQSDHSLNVALYTASASVLLNPANEVALMYGYLHDRSGKGNNAQQVGVGYMYFLSKRSTLYALAGLVDNRNQATHGLEGTEYSGIPVTPGATARGVIIGLMHKF